MDPAKLPVYFLARDFGTRTNHISAKIGERRRDLADQLRRAAASITLNIAEGAGEFRPREKARFYRMARRSATECAGILDAAVDQRLLTAPEARCDRELLRRIIAQLVRLCKRMDAAPRHPSREK